MRHAPMQSHANREEAPNLQALPADALLNRRELSALSGYAIITLKIWAANGRGPRITRVEGRPRYRVEDVREWMGVKAVRIQTEQVQNAAGCAGILG